jgi:serine acetyltransferase
MTVSTFCHWVSLQPLASSMYSFKKSLMGMLISPENHGVVLDHAGGIVAMPQVAIVVEG